MTTLKIGVSDFPFDRDRYFKDFGVVEVRQGLFSPPNDKTLRRWSRQAPEGFEHVWTAWQWFTHDSRAIRTGQAIELLEGEKLENFGLFRDTPECRRAWSMVSASAQALKASILLLETPASFTPSPTHKDRLRAWAKDWGNIPEGMKVAWFPYGFWQREEAIELATELGFILAVDPFLEPDEPLPPGPVGYFKLNGRVGIGNSYTADDLERLHELAALYDTLYLIFRTETGIKDARQMKRVAAQLGDPALLADFADDEDDDLDDEDNDFEGDEGDFEGDEDEDGDDFDDEDEDEDDADDEPPPPAPKRKR